MVINRKIGQFLECKHFFVLFRHCLFALPKKGGGKIADSRCKKAGVFLRGYRYFRGGGFVEKKKKSAHASCFPLVELLLIIVDKRQK